MDCMWKLYAEKDFDGAQMQQRCNARMAMDPNKDLFATGASSSSISSSSSNVKIEIEDSDI